jgi:hypothetical protein
VILSAKKLRRIVADSFGIKAHEIVFITGPAKWMNAVATECEKVGASPLLGPILPPGAHIKASQTRFRSVTDDQLLAVVEKVDAWIEICLPLVFPRRRSRTKQTRKKPEAGFRSSPARSRTRTHVCPRTLSSYAPPLPN